MWLELVSVFLCILVESVLVVRKFHFEYNLFKGEIIAKTVALHGWKKINTIRKEFNEEFSYLRLSIFPSDQREKSRKIPFNGEQSLASVREIDNSRDINVHGRALVKTIEKQFDEIYGLYAQVCYTEENGKRLAREWI